mmetsp:Transcript_30358/g.30843  ORF Transcript_30358/g.30843 Transcript_30358/m.30843 type:complete len:195 (-) Transcript_30358:326-910(-)
MSHRKMKLEAVFFTISDFSGNYCGYNLNPGRVHPAVAREMKRRPTSTAPSSKSRKSLEVAVKRVTELLDNNQSHMTMVLKSFSKMNIKCNNHFYVALNNTRDSLEQAASFVKRFKDANQGFNLLHKEGSFLKCASLYMDGRYDYDHEYFQRMIERDRRMNAEVIGCVITGMSELNKDKLFSDDDSMPDLQDKTR